MFEGFVQKIVDNQIEKGTLDREDRNIYLYGYQMLIEFCINIFTSIVIAFVFEAAEIVVVFTIAYLLLRGYVGGYHAKTSLGCFCCSAMMLISAVVLVKLVAGMEIGRYFFWSEIIIVPSVFTETPMPDVHKPITKNESNYFNKKVKQIYLIQLIIELFFLYMDVKEYALSIWSVHVVLFGMVVLEVIRKKWSHYHKPT